MGKTLVTGATGFIGSAVVRRLLERGRELRCLVEPGAPLGNLDNLDVELVHGDITSREQVGKAMRGIDVVYHLAAIYKLWLPEPWRMYDVNCEGSKTVLFAAQRVGVDKVVFTSSIAAVGPAAQDGELADENTRFTGWAEANDYIRSKFMSELDAMRFAAEGLPVVVVNPAFPFGARDIAPTPTGKFIVEALEERIPGYIDGGFNAVDVDDVAEGHVLAEEKGEIGQRYILGEHNVTFKDFYDAVTEVGGVKAIRRKLPTRTTWGMAWLMEKAATRRGKEPRVTYDSARYASRKLWFDTRKAHEELGMPRTPLRQTVEKAIRWFRAHNYA